MKFRAIMTDPTNIRLFAYVISTLQKFSKTVVLRVMPDKLAFVLIEKTGGSSNNNQTQGAVAGGATCWCEIPSEPYYTEYNMEGITPQDNEIYMEIASDVFAGSLTALKTSQNVTCLKLKLTKKRVPCLTLEIESENNNTPLTCTHDIPINVINRRAWPDFQCPDLPQFNISLEMPDLKLLRQSLERLKNISPKLTFKMSKDGKLLMSVTTYSVQSTVTFPTLNICNINDEGTGTRSEEPILLGSEQNYSVEVDMKSIIRLFPSEGVKPTSIICSMSDSLLLHWLISFGDIKINYFVPGSIAV